MPDTLDDFNMPNPEDRAAYTHLFRHANGTVFGVKRLMFHWTLHTGIHELGYCDRYCYATEADAVLDMARYPWGGLHPPGRWHKHPASGTRRDPDTGFTWNEKEPWPEVERRRVEHAEKI